MVPESMNSSSPSSLSSEALTARLAELLLRERECVLEFVFLLAELRWRGTHLELGYDSLFTYCRKALGLSKAYAYRRSSAAELLVRFPVIAEYLRDSRLCLSTLVPLKKLLHRDNHLDILNRASGMTEEEVELLVVTLQPRPEVRDVIRHVPARISELRLAGSGPEPTPVVAPAFNVIPDIALVTPTLSAGLVPGSTGAVDLPMTATLRPRPARFELLTPETVRIAMSVGTDFRDQLDEVKAALSHVVPDGNLEALLRECFRITLEVCMRRKVGAPRSPTAVSAAHASLPGSSAGSVEEPGSSPVLPATPEDKRGAPSDERAGPRASEPVATASSGAGSGPEPMWPLELDDERSRRIPTNVRAFVWERDSGSCNFTGTTGHRCGSRHQLEFHHLVAFALGGPSTITNIHLRCRAHNSHQACLDFGAAHMSRFSSASWDE